MSSVTSTREIALLALTLGALSRAELVSKRKKPDPLDAILILVYSGVFLVALLAWMFSW